LPELVDQPVDRDGLVSVQEEDGEQRALLGAADTNLASLRPDLDRAEDPKLHVRRSVNRLLCGPKWRECRSLLPFLCPRRPALRKSFTACPHARRDRSHRAIETKGASR